MEKMKKRLDAMISADLYDYIKAESDQTGIPMNMITDDLLTRAIAYKRGEVIEQQSIPVIREAIQTELRKATAQLREGIREDMSLEFTNEFKAVVRASDNRLAALLVRACRDTIIGRRLLYTLLAKLYGPDFAMQTYEKVRERTGKELSERRHKGEDDE